MLRRTARLGASVGDSDTEDAGLLDGEEAAAGTRGDNIDADGDGLSDYEETIALVMNCPNIHATSRHSLHAIDNDGAMGRLPIPPDSQGCETE